MITIPTLAGVPASLAPLMADPIAARCALSMAAPGKIAVTRSRSIAIEHAVLRRELEDWFERAVRPLKVFRPKVHVWLNSAPNCECAAGPDRFSIWFGNVTGDSWDSRWSLEQRFKTLAAQAPGLAQSALNAICYAGHHGIPVYTPSEALGLCGWTYWYGETDEKYAMEEYLHCAAGDEEDPDKKAAREEAEKDCPIPKRSWFDKQVPLEASETKGSLSEPQLERLERRRGEVGEIARKTALLRAAIKTARRTKEKFAFHREQDDLHCVGYGAALRWNTRDPLPRIFDDYANHLFESSLVETLYGWIVLEGPRQFRAALDYLEQRIAVAKITEDLIMMIATRSRK